MREGQELLSVSCVDRQKSSCFRIQHVPISLVHRSPNPPVSESLWDPNRFVAEIHSYWSDLRFLPTVPLSTPHLLTDSFPFHLVPLSSNASAHRELDLSFQGGARMTCCTCHGQRTVCGIRSLFIMWALPRTQLRSLGLGPAGKHPKLLGIWLTSFTDLQWKIQFVKYICMHYTCTHIWC